MDIQFPRWSERRKWDLQVHTPYSYLNHNFGKDFDEYVKQLFRGAIEKEVCVIGITDYFCIEGYKKIKNDYLANEQKLKELFTDKEIQQIKKIKIFPNIEFRLNTLVNSNRVNFHVIFSDEIETTDIEENFLHDLDFILESKPQNPDEKHKLKLINLENLWKKLKSEHADFSEEQDLFVGMKCVVVDHSQITEILTTKRSKFEGMYVMCIPADEDLSQISWNWQDHNVRKVHIQKSDFLFSSNAKTIKWGLGNTYNDKEDYIKEFKTLKPCVWWCDAHAYDKLFEPDKKRYTWIKADPTFEWLKQVIYEPERVYIGEWNPLLNRTQTEAWKFIDRLYISKADWSTTKGWFENLEINLNKELVVIIGNKGNWKSAISDIIGLLGNSNLWNEKKRDENFSFLNKDKFLQRKLWQNFKAELVRLDGNKSEKNLYNYVQDNEAEKVKYLPQRYFENVCNDIEKRNFEEELNNVVFSNLEKSLQLGQDSFNELIKFKSEEIDSSISLIKNDIEKLNVAITELEEKATGGYKEKMQNLLNEKKIELENLKEPEKIDAPSETTTDPQIQASMREVDNINQEIKKIDEEISDYESKRVELQLEKEEINKFLYWVNTLKQQITDFKEENIDFLRKYEIEIWGITGVEEENINKLKQKKSEFEKEVEKIDKLLDKTDVSNDMSYMKTELDELKTHSLFCKKEKLQKKLNTLRDTLNKPLKDYQEYQEKYKLREEKKNFMIWTDETIWTIKYYQAVLAYLSDKIYRELETMNIRRIDLSISIFNKKKEIIEIYNSLSSPIKKIINKYKEHFEKTNYTISIDVWFKLDKFEKDFLDFIDKSKQWVFMWNEKAFKEIKQIIDVDINSESWIKNILNESIEKLTENKNSLHNQIKKDKVAEFYDYLFSLDYISVQYELKLDNKTLEQLSPGEKGSLLLIFYLMLDTKHIPLVIDQPEDNLDNETVSRMLVPFIKSAKEYRQIIIVTHNPNLAIVADAEQIIFVEIDKKDDNLFKIMSGSIECDEINDVIVKILEWTKPAFDKRKLRYKN